MWLLNLRGPDPRPRAPGPAFCIASSDGTAQLFVDPRAVPPAVATHLLMADVALLPREQVTVVLSDASQGPMGYSYDPRTCSVALCRALGDNPRVVCTPQPSLVGALRGRGGEGGGPRA